MVLSLRFRKGWSMSKSIKEELILFNWRVIVEEKTEGKENYQIKKKKKKKKKKEGN